MDKERSKSRTVKAERWVQAWYVGKKTIYMEGRSTTEEDENVKSKKYARIVARGGG